MEDPSPASGASGTSFLASGVDRRVLEDAAEVKMEVTLIQNLTDGSFEGVYPRATEGDSLALEGL